jgi:hypothetical protein
LLRNFTYTLEEETYWDRPYPVSEAAFANIPIIGRPLAATIGRLVKPPRLMHVSDWAREGPGGDIEFASRPEHYGPAPGLGGLPPGRPGSPYAPGFQIGYLNYQFRELEGMTGWASNVLTKAITGSETFGTQRPVLGSSAAMTSPREAFWELALGGGFFTTEMVRRFLPRTRTELNEYNPILNSMPSWLPDRFHYGDPLRVVEMGYSRLPGPGYSAIHPELKGVDPENYPLIYQYSILADVAGTSSEFNILRRKLYERRQAKRTSEAENAYMDNIDRMLGERQVVNQFDAVHKNAYLLPGAGGTQAAWSAAQGVVRDVAAPLEYMVPMGFRPFQKLLSDRDPIEDYEYRRMYGTNLAFWDKPIRDWFRPAFYSAAHMMGYQGKPLWRKDADDINEHFDKLQFMKSMTLARQAVNGTDRNRHLYEAQRTRYGVNPQGNPLGIYASLPDSEKAYYDAFAYAQGGQRSRIMEMIPGDQQHLYRAIWDRMDRGDVPHPGSPVQVDEARLNRRFHDLQGYFSDKPLPREDWIGWHEDAELDDIQLRYIERQGKDIHEFDMWRSQSRMLARKPYLDGSENFMYQGPGVGRDSIAADLFHMGRVGGWNPAPMEMNVFSSSGMTGTYGSMYYNDDRELQLARGLNHVLSQ